MEEAIEIKIGGTLTINDKKYRCEEAEKNCCLQCDLDQMDCWNLCHAIKCTSQERNDEKNVTFRLIED